MSVNFGRLAGGLLGLFVCGSALGAPPPPPEPEGYIVAPFENGSPWRSLDWMSSALAVTLAEKLEEDAALRPAYSSAILAGMEKAFDPEKVARHAIEVGARWVFGGVCGRPNWKSELKVRLYAVVEPSDSIDRPTLRMVAESGSIGERHAVLDQLDQHLAAVLKQAALEPEPDGAARMKRRPTRDLYAFTLFGRALNLYYGLGAGRDLAGALKLLKRVNLIDPKFAEAHRLQGMIFVELGERARGASQYSYALDLKPGSFATLVGLARLYRADGNRARAAEMAEKAIGERPYDVESREMLGELLWETGDLDRALNELEKVTVVQPRHVGARRTLAMIYAAKGDTIDLAAELERVAELQPDDLEVKLDLASAYQRMGALDKAIGLYEELLKQRPRSAPALKFLGDCYRHKREFDRAVGAYQRLLKLQPDDPRAYFLLGAAYAEAGSDAKAEQMFQEAQQFRRYLGEAWTNLGSIAFRRGDLTKATWYLSRAVARSPSRPKAHYNYALLLSARKERDHALEELKIAGDLDPEDAEIRYLTGVILLRQGRLDEAKAQFEAALKRRPSHADAKHNLALLEELDKRYGSEHSGVGAR